MYRPNRQVWIALAIMLGLGLSLEAIKGLGRDAWANKVGRVFGYSGEDEISPDLSEQRRSDRHSANRARARIQSRVAGLSAVTAEVAPVPAAGPAVSAAVDLALNAAATKAAHDLSLAKAKKAKEKKKKKKKADEKKEPQAIVSVTERDDRGDSGTSGGAALSTSTTAGTAGFGAAAPAENLEDPKTLEEWLKFILREPNYDRTLKMIEAQQSRTLDVTIFHEVTKQMVADSREKMQEFGVLALGSAPSARSYVLLQTANLSLPVGAPAKAQSRAHLASYSQPEFVRYLASAIASAPLPEIAYEALRLIQLAVETQMRAVSRPSEGGGGPRASTIPRAVAQQFTTMLPLLTRVAQSSDESVLREEASTTIKRIQAAFGVPLTPPPAGPSGPGNVPSKASPQLSSNW